MKMRHFVITTEPVNGHKLHQFSNRERASAWAAGHPFGIVEAVYEVGTREPEEVDHWLDFLMFRADTDTFIVHAD